jgi:hypothetical protein
MNSFPNMARPATGLEVALSEVRPKSNSLSVFGSGQEPTTTPKTSEQKEIR